MKDLGACLDENEVLDFAAGRLLPPALARLEAPTVVPPTPTSSRPSRTAARTAGKPTFCV
jgi:hypothetical protein